MHQIAIIGPTASGKSKLAIKLAKNNNSYILSLDSLAIYKEINISSAKISKDEQNGVKHFGLDLIYANQSFSVSDYIKLYKEIKEIAKKDNKNIIIVGGSSFYLYILIKGLSPLPQISKETKDKTENLLKNLPLAYKFIYNLDFEYMKNIKAMDKYRIEKALNIYFQTKDIPSIYFKKNPMKPIIEDIIHIKNIKINKDILRKKVTNRVNLMINNGLLDEVDYLLKKYGKSPNCMKAIGIAEVVKYFDGEYSKNEMKEKIITNSMRLAKRQNTFNLKFKKMLFFEDIY